MAGLQGWHLIIILVIILLLFGAPKLPALARSLGQSVKILRKEVSSDEKKGEGVSAESASTEGATTEPAAAEPVKTEAAKESKPEA